LEKISSFARSYYSTILSTYKKLYYFNVVLSYVFILKKVFFLLGLILMLALGLTLCWSALGFVLTVWQFSFFTDDKFATYKAKDIIRLFVTCEANCGVYIFANYTPAFYAPRG
jgi:hypothetical protein